MSAGRMKSRFADELALPRTGLRAGLFVGLRGGHCGGAFVIAWLRCLLCLVPAYCPAKILVDREGVAYLPTREVRLQASQKAGPNDRRKWRLSTAIATSKIRGNPS